MRPEDVVNVLMSLAANADKLNKAQVKELFRILIAVGNFPVCPACHQPITSMKEFSWDHIYPASRRGSHEICNMQPMHRACNEAKSNMIQPEYFDTSYEITAEIHVEIVARKESRKKKKNRKVAHYKPHQIAEMGFVSRRREKKH